MIDVIKNPTNIEKDLSFAKLLYEVGDEVKLYKRYIIDKFGTEFYENELKNYSFIYPWTNEQLKKYYNYIDLTGKKVLTIDGSGDHPIHISLAGARKIDAIDSNPLAKYYSILKMAIMKTSDYNEFKKSFQKIFQNGEYIIKKDFDLDKIKDVVPDSVSFFWNGLLSNRYKNPSNLFYKDTIVSCENVCDFFNKDKYYKAKNALLESEIIHYTLSIEEPNITDILDKYDAIFLSNVLEWLEKYDNKFIDNIGDLLMPGGVLYCYHMSRDIKKYKFIDMAFEKEIITDNNYPNSGVTIYRKQ